MAAIKQEINGILLHIAAKYVTDFAWWSDCAGRDGIHGRANGHTVSVQRAQYTLSQIQQADSGYVTVIPNVEPQ
jgi:hypothetical protein